MPKVFVTRPIPDAGLKLLREVFGESSVDVYPVDAITPHERVLERVHPAGPTVRQAAQVSPR